MKRRTLLAGLAALPFFATAARAQDKVLVEVSKYLNQLRQVTGRFTQINSDGSRATGTYYLRRPGMIRFEYDGGDAMVISDGINIGVFDAKSNAGVQRYLLRATPLRFLLRNRIDLTERNLARGTASKDGYTTVVLQDPKAPKDGSMSLVLRNRPPALTQWTVQEKTGQRTTVVLDTLEHTTGLERRLFSIEYEEILFNRRS